MTIEWTPDRVSTLIALWSEGVTASEIGRRLNASKNAVIGKVFRIGLQKRLPPISKKPEKAEPIGLESLRMGMCNWPEGDPGTESFSFCGRPSITGKPYCPEHCAKAYVIGVQRKKAAA